MSFDESLQPPKSLRGLSDQSTPSLLKKVFLLVIAICLISLMIDNQGHFVANYEHIMAAIKIENSFQLSPNQQEGNALPDSRQVLIKEIGDSKMPFPKYSIKTSTPTTSTIIKHSVATIEPIEISFQPSSMKQEGNSLPDSRQVPIRGIGDSQMPFPKYGKYLDTLHTDLWKERPSGVDSPDPNNPPLKKILFYNAAGKIMHYNFGFGREPFIKSNCPVNTCMTTANRSRFPEEEVDAVIWQIRSNDQTFPKKRSPHTRYVFWLLESPVNMLRIRPITPVRYRFNWTMTYRMDSDIPMPYGVVYRRRTPIPLLDFRNVTASKTKLIVWFVSRCIGPRAQYMAELQKYITVDIYGECGKLKCGRRGVYDTCFDMVDKTYKFYMAFENSLCIDYITEKLFNSLRVFMIPVVFGLGNYKIVAPPHSYINSLDFKTPKDLADYLLYLDKNDTAYLEYFRWKTYHHPPIREPNDLTPYCELCAKLHNDHKEKVVDLQDWWMEKSHCKESFGQAQHFYNTWNQLEDRMKNGI